MNLSFDVWRLIVLICTTKTIKILCLTHKSFYNLCDEKNLWLEKFKRQNLEIINNNLNTINDYINEYKMLSYSTYITNCLINRQNVY